MVPHLSVLLQIAIYMNFAWFPHRFGGSVCGLDGFSMLPACFTSSDCGIGRILHGSPLVFTSSDCSLQVFSMVPAQVWWFSLWFGRILHDSRLSLLVQITGLDVVCMVPHMS